MILVDTGRLISEGPNAERFCFEVFVRCSYRRSWASWVPAFRVLPQTLSEDETEPKQTSMQVETEGVCLLEDGWIGSPLSELAWLPCVMGET